MMRAACLVLAFGCSDAEMHVLGELPAKSAKIDALLGNSGVGVVHGYFSEVSGIAVDSMNRIIIADAVANTVAVFSSSGTYRFSVDSGDVGTAHGLAAPCCVSIAAEGSLWVSERAKRRYVSYRLLKDRAILLKSIPTGSSSSGRLTRIAWDSSGRLIHIWDELVQSDARFHVIRSVVGKDGLVVEQDTLPNPSGEGLDAAQFTIDGVNGTTEVSQPFGPRPLLGFGPDGEVISAVSSNYAVSWLDKRRRRIHYLTRALNGPTTSRRERHRAETELDRLTANAGIPLAALPFGVPDRKAVLRSVGFDLDGRVWVERSVSDRAPRLADVYDRSGDRVGLMRWPATLSLSLLAVHGEGGFGVVRDSAGRERVARISFH
jgi:hypothetical protein